MALLFARLHRFLRSRSWAQARPGVTAPLVALSMVGLLGMAAAALDGGLLYVEQRRLQNIADAAALAGTRELPGSTADALAQAQAYVLNNGGTADDIEEIAVQQVYNPNDSVRVTLSHNLKLIFAPVLGHTTQLVRARSVGLTAQVEPLGLWPWGITQDSIGPGEITLKMGAPGSDKGNFYALSFTGSSGGASDYLHQIENGFDGPVPTDVPPNTWSLNTQTGNMAGPTQTGANYLLGLPGCTLPGVDIRCPRIGLVPVLKAYSWQMVNGNKPVDVIDFAVMQLDGITQGPNGQEEVFAQFLTYARAGGRPTRLGQPLTKLLGVRLWQ